VRVKTTYRGTIHSDRNFGLAGENFDGARLGLAFLQAEVVPTAVSIHRVTPAGTCATKVSPRLFTYTHMYRKMPKLESTTTAKIIYICFPNLEEKLILLRGF